MGVKITRTCFNRNEHHNTELKMDPTKNRGLKYQLEGTVENNYNIEKQNITSEA